MVRPRMNSVNYSLSIFYWLTAEKEVAFSVCDLRQTVNELRYIAISLHDPDLPGGSVAVLA